MEGGLGGLGRVLFWQQLSRGWGRERCGDGGVLVVCRKALKGLEGEQNRLVLL